MRPVTAHTSICAPREEIFDYVADIATRVAYADHYLRDFRLARAKSYGPGAAASFLIKAPFASARAEAVIVECDRPRRVVERGRMGRLGRSRTGVLWELLRDAPGSTRVELTLWTEPATRLDALRESLGARRWLRRQARVTLERLRTIFEEPLETPPARATIAGYEPAKAARFGM